MPAPALVLIPPALVALGKAVAVVGSAAVVAAGVVGGGRYLINEMSEADEEAGKRSADGSVVEACSECPCKRTVIISRAASPQAAQHIVDAQAAGHPTSLTLDRPGAVARRTNSLRGIPTYPSMDRDEYPPAIFLEGGIGASVRHIPLSDNRSAGAQMRNQLRGARDGCIITMTVGS